MITLILIDIGMSENFLIGIPVRERRFFEKKIVKNGSSLGLRIPSDILKLYGWNINTKIIIECSTTEKIITIKGLK